MYLWLKLLHVFFIISWFAGLFYLPRIFVNLAMSTPESDEYRRLLLMAQKLYRFMTPWGIGALICGLAFPFINGWMSQGWVHAKTLIGVLLVFYHLYCGSLLRAFAANRNQRSHKWYRFFNEVPVFMMIAALYLVIFKPF